MTGVALSACAVAACLTSVGRVSSTARTGAQVRVLVGPTGGLAVVPAGAAVSAPDLRPGHVASGVVSVRNQMARPVALRVDAAGDGASADVGEDLVVTIRDGHAPTFEATVRALRDEHPAGVTLGAGEERDLTVTVRLRDGARGYEGAAVDVPLHFAEVPVDA